MASHLSLFLLFNLALFQGFSASGGLVFEDGYTVSTVFDGNKLNVNPHSIVPQFGSSDLLLLDSSDSAVYTVSFSASQETAIKRLTGNGIGKKDGDLASAMFDKPKSFAVDLNGNVYVADKGNLAIRKISKSGVTTIAGGHSKIPGRADGPGRNASFSSDFELAFVPERCALMICDHGHQLVRQINLKSQDCVRGSQSALGMSAWALGLGGFLLGLVIGFAVRPYVTPRKSSSHLHFNETWKHYLINQGRRVLIICFDIRSAVVSSTLYAVLSRFIMLGSSHLSLMFRINVVESQTLHKKPIYKKSVSLLDSEFLGSNEMTKSQMFADQLKDLFTFDGGVELPGSADKNFEQGNKKEERNDVSSHGHQRIDYMIEANIMGFAEQANEVPPESSLVSSSGLVKRR